MQVLRLGDVHASVALVRSALVSLELTAPVDPDTARVFDDNLELAVRHFQQLRRLIVDGKVDSATWRELEEAGYRLGARTLIYRLSSPMTGDDVTELQGRLLELGYNAGRHDGVLGSQTHLALCTFQNDYGLSADGICGPATIRALTPLSKVTGGSLHRIREEEAVRVAGPSLRGKRIVVDPGHGGSDGGSIGVGPAGELREADVTWDVATLFEGRMAAAGVQTVLTRSQHSSPSTTERATLANSIEADLMISLHVDAQRSSRPNGVATFHFGAEHGASSTVGEGLAQLVQRELAARTGLLDGRTHARTWELLRRTTMPTVHVELGYLSHDGDLAYLSQAGHLTTIADALVVAVKRLYLMGVDDQPTGSFTYEELLAAELSG